MQIVNEKPQIDLALKVCLWALRQEVEQKDRKTDPLKIYSCLKEFETANFETRNPQMKFSVSSNTSTLSGKMYKVKESGLDFLQAVENSALDYNLKLTETGSQIAADREIEPCSYRLALEGKLLRA